jgi:phosphoribosylamine--glycine ligase
MRSLESGLILSLPTDEGVNKGSEAMRVLVVGSGGREHALCWAIAASPLCDKLYCAPGNAGIAQEAECVPIGADRIEELVAFAREKKIEFVVVGPEAPLVAGLVDKLEAAGIPAFGPTAAAAALEGSKGFMKDLCQRYAIPTAAFGHFTEASAAKTYVAERGAPIVVKADGLAAGKGVVIAETVEEASAAIDDMMGNKIFGAAPTLAAWAPIRRRRRRRRCWRRRSWARSSARRSPPWPRRAAPSRACFTPG